MRVRVRASIVSKYGQALSRKGWYGNGLRKGQKQEQEHREQVGRTLYGTSLGERRGGASEACSNYIGKRVFEGNGTRFRQLTTCCVIKFELVFR